MRRLNYFENRSKLPAIDALAYLERLQLKRELPSLSYLKKIHRQHLATIPHENLDIHFNKFISWEIDPIFEKVIEGKRGGNNLELNFLFYHLLSQLGFDCYTVSASFYQGEEVGSAYQHLVILVSIEESIWLVDVGHQKGPFLPKRLIENELQVDYNRYLSFFTDSDDNWHLKSSKDTRQFETMYRFALDEAQLIEFIQMHQFYQRDEKSPYRDGKLITQFFPEGRITLTDKKLVNWMNGIGEEIPIMNEDEFLSKLEEFFGIRLQDLLK